MLAASATAPAPDAVTEQLRSRLAAALTLSLAGDD
jgi:hypothetical protein